MSSARAARSSPPLVALLLALSAGQAFAQPATPEADGGLPPPVAGVLGRFVPPDTGAAAAAYTCTFHWFRTADGRIVGLDVVRSGDAGRMGLRVFVADREGGLRALIHEAPASEWEPFQTGAPPALTGPGNALGRGPGWVGARVHGSGPSLHEAAFELHVTPLEPGCTAGDLGLDFLHLSATDFPLVRTQGRLVIDGEELAIDATGPCSIHFGRSLPDYAYLATVPELDAPAGPGLLLAATRGDNLRKGGELVGERAFTYAHFLDLPGDLPRLKFVSLRRPQPGQARYHFPVLGVPAFGKTVVVTRVLSAVEHTLLGRPTTTYLAEVELQVPRLWPPLVRAKHRVLAIGDVRGEVFQAQVGLGPTAAPEAEAPSTGLAQRVDGQ